MDNIRGGAIEDICSIADYQLKMADEIYNLKLDRKLVEDAVQYIMKHKEYGHYLICTDSKNQACGCLLVTYENKQTWWIQSVFVIPEERKKGNFARLFQATIKQAKQNGVNAVQLYANQQNHKAKQVYTRLGMKNIGRKLFGVDLTYGKGEIIEYLKSGNKNGFEIQSNIAKQLQETLTILPKILGESNNNKKLFAFRKQNPMKILGYCEYFSEFSDWRFGLTLYINVLFSLPENESQVIDEFIKYLYNNSDLNVGAIRFLLTKQQIVIASKLCQKMHEQQDEVFLINL